ncbi:hypothetical protein [Enterococcus sp. 2201sp1_2201st1_B8_2201SCRN_220225]|uniref:hypothetical protein n=1 Tax=unclassified Enterococcus TaxID=2608891 RepID=UPI0034A48C53
MEAKQSFVRVTTGDIEDDSKTISMEISGMSKMAVYHQDLLFAAAISILETTDQKIFYEEGLEKEYFDLIARLHEAVSYLE